MKKKKTQRPLLSPSLAKRGRGELCGCKRHEQIQPHLKLLRYALEELQGDLKKISEQLRLFNQAGERVDKVLKMIGDEK